MSPATQQPIFDAALALPPDSRAELAQLLLHSLPAGVPSATAAMGTENPGGDKALEELAAALTAHFHEAKRAALGVQPDAGQPSNTDALS